MEAQEGYVTEIARLFPRQGEWTERDFFALPESTRPLELARGKIVMAPAPDDRHQHISGELFFALKAHVDAHQLGVVRHAPYDVRLFPGTIRQPDLVFIRSEHMDRIVGRYFDGPPDWVAEIISPGSRELDEEVKLVEYAQAGVPEYWLVDPENRTIRVYTLQGEAYTLTSTASSGQVAHSTTIEGFEVPVGGVFGKL
jgi:Uma2 family endonuclease